MAARPRLGVTLGDPRGIGPEVVARALATPLDADITVVGADDQIADLTEVRKVGVGVWGRGKGEEGRLGAGSTLPPSPVPLPVIAGQLAGRSVEEAVRLAHAGEVNAIVTGPVHKHALHLAGYRYPGLTEFLSHLAGHADVAMMLAAGQLRVVLVTTHLPLRDVPDQVTTARVVQVGRITTAALTRWWGIARPRLAVCALNPHAGESGLFGTEDAEVLRPAESRITWDVSPVA